MPFIQITFAENRQQVVEDVFNNIFLQIIT